MIDFSSSDTPALAKGLLGCWLCRRMPDGSLFRARISECEAYHGSEDLACHASKGKTPRTEVMFGPSGHIYMYLCYGIHWMLNVVTGPEDFPAAILIRGVEGIRGPGRLSKALHLDRSQNRLPLSEDSGLWLEEGPVPIRIEATPRIGIDTVPSPWHEKVWRFVALEFS